MSEIRKPSPFGGISTLVLGISPYITFLILMGTRKGEYAAVTLYLAGAGVVAGIITLFTKCRARKLAVVGLILGAAYLILALVIFLYFTFAEPDDFSRGDV